MTTRTQIGVEMKTNQCQNTGIILLLILTIACFMTGMVSAQDNDVTNQAKESYNLGLEAQQKGDTADAISYYKGAIAGDPELSDAYLNLGSIYFAQKKYADAQANFKKASELNPTDALGFSNLGKAYYAMKRYDAALTAFQGASAADPANSSVKKEIAKIYYNQKNYDECIATYEDYFKNDGDAYSYYQCGMAFRKKKQNNKAVTYFKKAVEADPNHFGSQYNLANIYRERESYSKAMTHYNIAKKLNSKHWRTFYNYAICVHSSDPENYDNIIAAYKAFLKVGRKDPKARKYISRTEKLVKDLEDAKAIEE